MTIGIELPGAPDSEARFTAPTERCPYPERWTSTDGDSTEVEVSDVAWGLVRALQPSLVVETGSGFGQTARRICDALAQNGHGQLVTIEPDPERAAATRRLVPEAAVVEAASLSWTPSGVIDFAWLDSHYELRVAEFIRYRPWMRSGTVVCFHDTAPEHGSHRIASGRDLHSEIQVALGSDLAIVRLPTPRGITIGEVV